MKLYQSGSMYDDMKKRGETRMFWFAMVCTFSPFVYIALLAIFGRS